MKAEYDFSQGVRGAVLPLPPGVTRVAIALDDEVLDWFRDRVEAVGGGDCQFLINAALREHIERQRARNETKVR